MIEFVFGLAKAWGAGKVLKVVGKDALKAVRGEPSVTGELVEKARAGIARAVDAFNPEDVGVAVERQRLEVAARNEWLVPRLESVLDDVLKPHGLTIRTTPGVALWAFQGGHFELELPPSLDFDTFSGLADEALHAMCREYPDLECTIRSGYSSMTYGP